MEGEMLRIECFKEGWRTGEMRTVLKKERIDLDKEQKETGWRKPAILSQKV